jgi:small GTP-binding protein
MGARDVMKAKLCLAGASSVGKTSLIRRYVLNEFDDRYIATVGTKISKKEVSVPVIDEEPVLVDLMVWDIMGQMGFRELLQEQYFQGAQGILAVADVTRRETLDDLYIWIDQIDRIAGAVPIVLALNKVDLPSEKHIAEADLHRFAHAFDCEIVRTSAKTGENVEEVFWRLARFVIRKALQHP